MSLDVSLYAAQPGHGGSGIFVREAGRVREISRAEWDDRFPGVEPLIAEHEAHGPIFTENITHNLARMADEAGVYTALWRPEEVGYTVAAQLIGPLSTGLALLESAPERFKAFNPENGWGNYEDLAEFVSRYLRACEEWPDARIEVSR